MDYKGTEGADIFLDTDGRDMIETLGGDDVITVRRGRDTVHAGEGDDRLVISYGWATETLCLEYSDSPTFLAHAFVSPTGGCGAADRLSATDRVYFMGVERLEVYAGSGDDRLTLSPGRPDTVNGGPGVDRLFDAFAPQDPSVRVSMELIATTGQSFLDGTFLRAVESVVLDLTDGPDGFTDFGPYDDTVRGRGGNDVLSSGGGHDFLFGGEGEDVLAIRYGDAAEPVAFTNSGPGRQANAEEATAAGTRLRSVVADGFEHADVVAGAAADRLRGFANRWDRFDGGAGRDVWIDDFSELATPLELSMTLLRGRRGQSLPDGSEIRDVETLELVLTPGADVFDDVGRLDARIDAGAGRDELISTGGRDDLDGGPGHDILRADWGQLSRDLVFVADRSGGGILHHADADPPFSGRDYLFATDFERIVVKFGAGDDLFRGDALGEKAAGGAGADTLHGAAGADVLLGGQGADGIEGGAGPDRLGGGPGDDRLAGQSGADKLRGDLGADRLFAGAGDDRLAGGAGADTLAGGSGRDHLFGGPGRDLLHGGGGPDRFHFRRGDGRDIVRDWTDGEDLIRFDSGAPRFAALVIRQRGDHVVIDHGAPGDRIKLLDADAEELGRADFVFA